MLIIGFDQAVKSSLSEEKNTLLYQGRPFECNATGGFWQAAVTAVTRAKKALDFQQNCPTLKSTT
jgi:hypothetical protein